MELFRDYLNVCGLWDTRIERLKVAATNAKRPIGILYYSDQLFMPSDVWRLRRDGELFKIEKDAWRDKKFISSTPKIAFFGVIEPSRGKFFFVPLFKRGWDAWRPRNLFSSRVSVTRDEKSRSDQYSMFRVCHITCSTVTFVLWSFIDLSLTSTCERTYHAPSHNHQIIELWR